MIEGITNTRDFEGKKGSLSHIKYASVSKPIFCVDCEFSTVHSTGSLLWTSCKFQTGWRSISSACNLPEKEAKINE